MSVPDTVRHGAREVIFEDYPEIGYNYRLTDLQAALGREQLRRLDDIVAARRWLAEIYADRLRHLSGLGIPAEPDWGRTNWQSYCVMLPAGADQRAVMQRMLDRGVSTRRGVMNAHLEGAYAAPGSHRVSGRLERSEHAQAQAIMLPLYPQMSAEDVALVCETLGEALAEIASPAG
jgi:dTDP-4-amino-4,6-dideoxygalactose transaminase